jgi:hypothetical protein
MPASKFSLTKIKIINQKLDRLIDFKRNLIFSLEKKPANITKVNDTVHPNNEIELSDKTILTEILETKKKGDLENYIHFSLLKEINVIIDELFLLFHLTQELDKEIMLLIDRMKEAKKNNAELKRFEEFLNETNKLENMERVKILIMLGMMQALNERYALLKTEKIKAHQSFTQDMLPTLENLQKDDGMHLTRSQKEEINDDLVKKEIELIERLLKIEDNKAESRAKLNINHPQVPSKDVAQFILPMFRAENRNQSSYKKIISSSSFKKAHETLVKETLQIH